MSKKLMNADFYPEPLDEIDCGFRMARFACAKCQYGTCPLETHSDLDYFRGLQVDQETFAGGRMNQQYCSWCASLLLRGKQCGDKPVPMIYERRSGQYRCLEQAHSMCVAQQLNTLHGLKIRVKVDVDIED